MFFTLAWIEVPIAGLVLPAFYPTELRSQSGAVRSTEVAAAYLVRRL